MRAVLCHSDCEPEDLVIEELPTPELSANEVLLNIHAAGINFPDCLMIAGKYQNQPPHPFSPGSEMAGEVVAVGEQVNDWQPGDLVIASAGYGGFAEQIAVRSNHLKAIPKGMDLITAAGFSTTYGTSFYALKQRAQLQPGETLLVLGAAGGVGIAAVELGKAMGARVIAAASTDEKLAAAKQAGASELINYADGELKEKVKALTSGKGADVIYDPVGGELFDQCMRCIAWNGRVLVIGFAAGDIPKVPMNLPLLKNCQIVGVFYGAFTTRETEQHQANVRAINALFEADKITPLTGKSFPMEEYAAALRCLMNRQALGKVVLKIR